MSESQINIFSDYLPAELHEGKTWYISYYVKNPVTKFLERRRIKCNRIRPLSERRKFAKAVIEEINDKLRKGWNPLMENEAPKGFHKFRDVLKTFTRQKIKGKSTDSVRSYKSFIKKLEEWLTEQEKAEIFAMQFTRSMARDFLLQVDETIESARTYNNHIAFYRNMFNWFIEFDYCKINPFDGFSKRLKEHKQRIQYIEPEIREKINSFLLRKDYNFYIACMFAFHVLVRPKELTFIKIKHIDLKKQQLFIPNRSAKNDKSRYPTIPNVMVEFLEKMKLEKYDPEMFLFTSGWVPGWENFNPRRVAKRWDWLRNKINMNSRIKFYSLRDSGIIQMLKDGISPDEVMYQADHYSLEITNEYVRITNPKIFTDVRDKATKF
ncbi:hypothetical protein ES705_20057 [subsurface metagenome]